MGAIGRAVLAVHAESTSHPVVLLPAVAVVLTTWLASWIGSRRVLTVTPLQAIGGAQELSREDTLARPRRNGAAVTLMIIGGAILVLGLFAGLVTPFAVLIGVVGGAALLQRPGARRAPHHAPGTATGRPDHAGRRVRPPRGRRTRSGIRSAARAARSGS